MFSALAVQITIPKYKEIPGQFYLLLQWAKHIKEAYMYFNLLLIISAADREMKLILSISSNCVLTVINASAAVTLLKQGPDKIQAMSGIRTHDLRDASAVPSQLSYQSHMGAIVRRLAWIFQVSVLVVLRPHLH